MFDEARLDEAVSHVLRAQERTMRQPESCELTEAEKESIARINRDCIQVFTDPGVPVALNKDKKYLFVVMMQKSFQHPDTHREVFVFILKFTFHIIKIQQFKHQSI